MPTHQRQRSGDRGQWMRSQMANNVAASQGSSFAGFKIAAAVIVFHFVCKILVQFADILVPFIMALLIVSVLEPVKQVALSVLECSFLLGFRKCSVFRCCLRESRKTTDSSGNTRSRARNRDASELGELIKKFCLFMSIIFTLLVAGRVFWIIGRIVWLSGEAITNDYKFYVAGIQKRQTQVQLLLRKVGLEDKVHLDMRHLAHYALVILKLLAEFLTQHVFYSMTQVSLTTIFAIFLLYSPVQRDFSPVMTGVFDSMETYLKLKTLISIGMAITNGTALALVGLEIPAAWGLMTFLANFIPNIGGPLMSVLPCVIALLDVRKTMYQVLTAFMAQFLLHFTIANFVEPVIFGTQEAIHSVMVILGLSFFGYIWGITGMFLSVPLLFAIHSWLACIARTPKYPMEAREDARFMMGMLEGTWLSDGVDDNEDQPDVNLLTGQIESMDGPAGGEAHVGKLSPEERQRVHGGVAEVKGPPTVNQTLKAQVEGWFDVFDRESGEIRCCGLVLRWIFLICIWSLLFFGPDVHIMIHPSGSTEVVPVGNTTLLGHASSFTTTPSFFAEDMPRSSALSAAAMMLTTESPTLGDGTAVAYSGTMTSRGHGASEDKVQTSPGTEQDT